MSYLEELEAGDVRLVVAPHIGGAIAAFSKAGQPMMHTASERALATLNPGGMSAFTMLPYCSRIREGVFTYAGRRVELPPNFPPEPHSVHGLAWQAPWTVVARDGHSVTLEFRHDGSEWPWPFRARQTYVLTTEGLEHTVTLTNEGANAMPGGLGVHPFFSRDEQTELHALFSGVWESDEAHFPLRWTALEGDGDPWRGTPVAARTVDQAFTGRRADPCIVWPDQPYTLTLHASDSLPVTVVYVPVEYAFFCVEPISHLPNAVNMEGVQPGMTDLAPDETLTGTVTYRIGARQG